MRRWARAASSKAFWIVCHSAVLCNSGTMPATIDGSKSSLNSPPAVAGQDSVLQHAVSCISHEGNVDRQEPIDRRVRGQVSEHQLLKCTIATQTFSRQQLGRGTQRLKFHRCASDRWRLKARERTVYWRGVSNWDDAVSWLTMPASPATCSGLASHSSFASGRGEICIFAHHPLSSPCRCRA